MQITRTKEMELRSSDYEHVTGLTGSSATIAAGEVTVLENTLGFPLCDVAVSTEYTKIVKASQVRAKKAAEAIDAGDNIFWDVTNNVVTKTSNAAHYLCGVAVESALLADTHILINFDGKNAAVVGT